MKFHQSDARDKIRGRVMKPTILTCAVTGSFPTRAQNPALPVTPQEIAEACIVCWPSARTRAARSEAVKPSERPMVEWPGKANASGSLETAQWGALFIQS